MLLALDPSINRCGLALFHRGQLVRAGYVSAPASKDDILSRVLDIAYLVREWCGDGLRNGEEIISEIAAEWPPVYTADKEVKGGPKAVVPLAGVCGAVAALLGGKPTSYEPADWVGQVPKIETVKGCKTSPRARKIKARLSAAELVIWDTETKYHDTIDAIGIGLHHLGRFDRKRVWGR